MIYFIQSGSDGPIKVGYTKNNVEYRLSALQGACPTELKVIGTTPGSEQGEKELHDALKAHRIRGEWFHPHPDVLAKIENHVSILKTRKRTLPENAHPLTIWLGFYLAIQG